MPSLGQNEVLLDALRSPTHHNGNGSSFRQTLNSLRTLYFE